MTQQSETVGMRCRIKTGSDFKLYCIQLIDQILMHPQSTDTPLEHFDKTVLNTEIIRSVKYLKPLQPLTQIL